MQILSFKFIIFIFLVFLLIFISKGKLRKPVLIVANVLFLLSFGNTIHLWWLVLVICFVYGISKYINNKGIFAFSIIAIVSSLSLFKYGTNFLGNIIVPIGISFYTFKSISYLVDLYQSKVERASFIDLFIHISFFPTVTAGPINRAKKFIEELNSEYIFDYKIFKNGAVLCACGMFQKIVFADYLGIIVNTILDNPKSTGIYAIVGMVLYSFYIYIDFDSYSNVAVGLGRMLGFNINRNFKTPYLSSSIMEFWDRWHISLSSWLKDYIYIPLGGNRKGIIRKYINIIIVFLISGIWHGSTIVFVLWGLGHGIVNVVEDMIKNLLCKINIPSVIKNIFKPIGIIINFMIVTFLWIFFREGNMSDAMDVIRKCMMLNGFNIDINLLRITQHEVYWIITILVVVIIIDIFRNKIDMIEWLSKRNFIIRWSFYILMIFTVIIFGVYGPGYNHADFIYAAF